MKAGERFGIALSPPPGCTDCVGTGGTKVFLFEAKAPGTTELRFALLPLGKSAGGAGASPESAKNVTVSVAVAQ